MAKQDKLNRMPPYLPIIVEDWQSDPDTQSMTDAQIGIFLKALLHQWQNGSLPRNAWDFAKKIDSSFDTTLRFLSTYSHLFVCCECSASWSREDCECGASKSRARCENTKLKNLRIDVNLGLGLGTTEPYQNQTEPEPNVTVPTNIVEVQPSALHSEPETPVAGVSEFLLAIASLFGKTRVNGSVLTKWETVLKPKVELYSEDHVLGLLKYALEENAVWARAITTVKKMDPVEYFVSKFEDIETTREGDEKFKKIRDRKRPAVGKEKNLAHIEEKIKPMEIV